jgi:hypothetical protein
MPREGPLGPVLLYFLIIGVISAGMSLFWSSIFDFASLASYFGADAPERGGLAAVVEFMLSPLIFLVILYLSAGVTHLILMVLDAADNGFNATLRVFAYGFGPAVFGIVPMLGSLVGTVWTAVIDIVGLREAHDTTNGKAAAGVLLPCGCLFAAVVMLGIMAAVLGVLGSKL